jgi:hypothetical protein
MLRKGIRVVLITALLCAVLTGCSEPAFLPGGEPEESTPQEIPLVYTEEYLLFSGGTDVDGNPLVGLMDRDRREILPAAYLEIGVAENGIVFARSEKNGIQTYRVFTSEGDQIGGDYAYIWCAVPPQEDDDWLYREATFAEMPPVPPYVAYTENDAGKRSCWLLDENGLPTEAEPYDDIDLYDDGSVAKCRDGILYYQDAEGTMTRSGNEVVQTFFDGKYYIKNYFPGVHAELFSLWDREGRQIAPPEYSTIQVPFEDRYVLYKGSRQFMGGEQAFLYDDTGRLLASNSNYFSFEIRPDGSYIGISYVGNPYDGYVDMQILDEVEILSRRASTLSIKTANGRVSATSI